MFLFYVIITNTMVYWYDGAALAATRSPVIALFWCLIKFTTTTYWIAAVCLFAVCLFDVCLFAVYLSAVYLFAVCQVRFYK